jgi:hypothetical protein
MKESSNSVLVPRYYQNTRVLREFPWLWGVRPQWAFAYDHLSVTKADETLRMFLHTETPDLGFEVWIYRDAVCNQYCVERVEWREHTPRYVHRIRDYTLGIEHLRYLALVREIKGGDSVVALDHRRVCVYRPARNGESWMPFFQTPPVQPLFTT